MPYLRRDKNIMTLSSLLEQLGDISTNITAGLGDNVEKILDDI